MMVQNLFVRNHRTHLFRLAGLLIPTLLLALLFGAGMVSTADSSQGLAPVSISVGLVADGPQVNEGGFSWLSYQGLQRAETQLGVTGNVYTSTTPADFEPQLQQCADDGNALCISVGFMMAEATWNAAQANPGTAFAISDVSWEEYPDNLRGMVFAAQQAGYLAGTLAGLMTDSHIIGDIGGMPIPSVDAFVYGYRNGARCINPDVQVLIAYAGDFGNPELGAQIAQELMGEGADVIFAPAGGTGMGAVMTATQSMVWGMGTDTDWYITVFDSGAVEGADKLLSSALKRLDNAVYETIADVQGGTFASGTALFDLSLDGVGLAPFHEAETAVPQSVRDALADVRQGIIDGVIDVNDPCWVSVRYVDGTSGVDLGDCLDPDQPCETVGYAISQSQPDDVIRIAQGTYVENLEIDRSLTLEGGYSGLAVAPGDAAWTRDPGLYETIIDGSAAPPSAGDWDGRAVRKVSVLRDGADLKMWYDGQELFYTPQIGLATSNDGLSWAKYGANPVLGPTPGGWDEFARELAPFVLKEGMTYKMWYEGQGEDGRRNLGYATSGDGIVWTKYGTSPVLQAGPQPYDQEGAAHGTVLYEGGTYKLWYHAVGDQGAIIAYATSPDGVSWAKGGPALLPAPGGWDEFALWGPSVLEMGGTYWMWYGGAGPMGPPAIGVVTSTDGLTWNRTLAAPVVTDMNPIGDPHVIADEGKLKMWYTDYAEGVVRYAESLDGISWTKTPDPVLTPGNLGDPGRPVMRLGTGHVVLDGLTITGGNSLHVGAVSSEEGGALTVQGCTIRDNVSYWDPNAWASAGILGGAPLTVIDSYFLNNQAGNAASALRPGDDLLVVNSVFAGNLGDAAIHSNYGVRLLNVTLADNQSDVIFNPQVDATLIMTNSIVYGHMGDSLRPSCEMSTCSVNYSDVEGGWPDGTGNIDFDPLFIGAGNYRLQRDSPCIDAGTAVGAPPYDLDGRLRDGWPDMGAYEWPPYGTFLPVVLRNSGP